MDWEREGKMVVDDVKHHVKEIEISKLFTDVGVYINVKTLEDKDFCIYLNSAGFKVVGFSFDCCDNHDDHDSEETIYETIYACIQKYSPGYTQSFGEELVSKLKELPS